MSDAEAHMAQSDNGVYIDIGERNLFYVALEDTVQYLEIYRSTCRVVLCAISTSNAKTTVRVSWSQYKRAAQSRGYRGMEACEGMACVPVLFSRDLHKIGCTYVEVSTREYMEGTPLSEVWCEMGEAERSEVARQVERFMQDTSQRSHNKFMSLQGRNLSTPDPVEYINYKMLLSMITRDLHSGDCSVTDMRTFSCLPTLCHGNLSMEHVIVRGTVVTGIVGWSSCDFVPEVMDRMRYHFARPRAEGELSWYSRLAKVLLFHPPPPPLYTATCVHYVYYLHVRSTPGECHPRLKRKLDETYELLMPSVRQSYMGFDPLEREPLATGRSRAEHLQPSSQLEQNPFSDEEEGSIESAEESSIETESSISGWSDNGTILDILDALSVV